MRIVIGVAVILMFLASILLVGLAWHVYDRRVQDQADADLDARLEDLIRKYGKQEAARPFECNPDTTPWTVG